jgi:hypothetical protein
LPRTAATDSARPDRRLPAGDQPCHARNVRVIGATLLPFEDALSGTPLDNYYHPDKGRSAPGDQSLDPGERRFRCRRGFRRVLRDPERRERIAPSFDSGDHLHPGDAGNRAMAEAIDLDALLGR